MTGSKPDAWWGEVTRPGPPALPPPPGRQYYLLEEYYFRDEQAPGGSLFVKSLKTTAVCLAQWAGSYVAHPSVQRRLIRRGTLPVEIRQRVVVIQQLFDWLASCPDPLVGGVLNLYDGTDAVLLLGEGLARSVLALTEKQYDEVQQCWLRNGLPRDLFYPARDQHVVIEPVAKFGSVVRHWQRYSPRSWAARPESSLPVPSEEERVTAFLSACEAFQDALQLRMAELLEPGKEADGAAQAARSAIAATSKQVRHLILQSRIRGDLPHETRLRQAGEGDETAEDAGDTSW